MIFTLPLHICSLPLFITLLSAQDPDLSGWHPGALLTSDSWLCCPVGEPAGDQRTWEGDAGILFYWLLPCWLPWVVKSRRLCWLAFSTLLAPWILVTAASSRFFRPKCPNNLVVSLYFAHTFVVWSLNHFWITQFDFTIYLLLVSLSDTCFHFKVCIGFVVCHCQLSFSLGIILYPWALASYRRIHWAAWLWTPVCLLFIKWPFMGPGPWCVFL